MPRPDNKRYERQVVLAMVIYTALLLIATPLLRLSQSVIWKTLLAVAPVLPMLYVIALMGRRIRDSDELEQRTHLVALGVATGVVSGLSMVGGFLTAGGVLHLGGEVLIWVFPALMLCYALARQWVARRYGVESVCSEEGSTWLPAYFAASGLLMGCLALYAWWRQQATDALALAVGAGFFLGMAAWARIRQVRVRRRAHEE